MVTELLKKYLWLVQTFIRAGERGLSLDEIMDKCEFFRDIPETYLSVYEAVWRDLKNTK